ncbi:MAG: histidine kinase [Ferruginibacter sp.]|nr:histidine kinase [Ferruginibacter sp.]
MMWNRFLLFALLLMPVTRLVAQYPFSKIIDIEEDNLTIKSTVLLKDHSGFLWIGTSEGLFKYNALDPEKIPLPQTGKTYITALYEDAKGTIWAGCKNGNIFTIKGQQAVYFTFNERRPKASITAIYGDGEGRIWFGTGGEGIYFYDQHRLQNISTKEGLSDDNVNCMYSPDGRQLIAGTDRGLSFIRIEAGKINVHFFSAKNGLPDNIVTTLAESREKNSIWVGMQSKGILLFDITGNRISDTSYKSKWRSGQVNDIIDSKDNIFLATEEKGVIFYDKATAEFTGNALAATDYSKRITDLQYDNEGNIWATFEGKLISFTSDYLRYWYSVNETGLSNVHSILADDEKKLWFTPDLRLYSGPQDKLGTTGLRSYDITPPKNHIDITSLYKDRFGCLWIGTMGEGLFRMNIETGKWRRITENPIAFYGNVLNITGKGDQVWISTLNGVARFDLKESSYDLNEKIAYRNYSKKDGLGSDYIYHILIDQKNRVWFATDGAGVTMLENDAFINFYAHKLFPAKVAYSLAEDKNHHLWISTYNDGLFEYDGKRFIRYGTENGLTDITITSIAIDDFNNIIAVNKKGIDVFNPRNNMVQHYGTESGFTEQQPNLNSITQGRDGKIWIGTNNGIVCLNTHSSLSGFAPVAVIERVSLFNNPLDTAVKKEFAYNQNNFSFKLAAAYYKAPEKIKFQYWLEGYSKRWETTGDNMINFPQLRPGTYSMKVRASANENFGSSPITSYRFTIARSFWTTWWFRTLVLVFAAALIYWLVRQRIKKVRKTEQEERERFQLQYDALKNQVNPHFLFNSFNALLNIVEDNPQEASVLIKHLSQFYRKMTAYSQKELITLAEELELLNSYLFIQSKRYGSALQVTVNIDTELKRSTFIPPLVLQLLAENAVKHNTISKDKPLYINIVSEPGQLVMRNNISPKLEKEESEGVGLKNIQNRYRLLTNREVRQEETSNEFIIRLPLIYIDGI